MKSRKQMRRDGYRVLKKHYVMLIMIYATIVVVGNLFSSAGGFATKKMQEEPVQLPALNKMFEYIFDDENKKDPIISEEDKDFYDSMFDSKEGVFASIINGIRSGAFYDSFALTIQKLIGSTRLSSLVLILLSSFILFVLWYFFINVSKTVGYRLYLEARCYESINLLHSLFLVKAKKWMHVAWVLFVTFLFRLLWMLTIVGGLIKNYAYFMVPFLLAENPDLKTKEAIDLSQRMMKGYKWKCFVFELSYLLWYVPIVILAALAEYLHPVVRAAISFGSSILILGPVLWTGYCEFAAEIRKLAIENGIEGTEKLTDTYLYEKPEDALREKVYEDVIKEAKLPVKNLKLTGYQKVLADWFGITFWHSKRERIYEENLARQNQIRILNREAKGELYPTRLSNLYDEKRFMLSDNIHYLRHYSVWSLVLMFFTFSMIGWFWEVVMHLVQTGEYANRGVMNGPWLPIYGAGAVMALILLNRFRANPALEFSLSIVLCGIVEYFTGYFLELKNDGTRWWDYSDYVLNLHGRICAEGLLVFGIGCVATVYVLAPLLDSLFRRLPRKRLVIACMVLTFAFCVDEGYSLRNPNKGEGVTTMGPNLSQNNNE